MSKSSTTIYFMYGSMNSGKSLELIKVAYNYRENNINPLILKPDIDTRVPGKIHSRTGLQLDALEFSIEDTADIKNKLSNLEVVPSVILIEECNFMKPNQIDALVDYAYDNDVSSVMFFGLKNDFRGNLFDGTKRVLELADKINESTSVCWCGKKARQNARVVDGKITKNGPTILVDDNLDVNYVVLCNYHFYVEELNNAKT